MLTYSAITKNGMIRLAAPPAPDLSKFQTDNKITDKEVLEILERQTAKPPGTKNKNKKKKKKPAKKAVEEDDDDSDDSDE